MSRVTCSNDFTLVDGMHTNSVSIKQFPCHSQLIEIKGDESEGVLRKGNALWSKIAIIYMKLKDKPDVGAVNGECYAGGTLFIP